MENILSRQFRGGEYRDVVISDLTYVRVKIYWIYLCVLIDLFNQEIIGYHTREKHKTAELIKKTFQSMEGNLRDIRLLYTPRRVNSKT